MVAKKGSTLITPYGEKLVDLMVPAESFDELKAYASQLPSIQISPRAVCDLELLATGALSPLDRFMGQEDYERVLSEMRLANGYIFPIPITLPVSVHPEVHVDSDIAIRNSEFELMAVMTIEEIYEWDRIRFTEGVVDSRDFQHRLLTEMQNWGPLNISGRIQVLQLPRHYDFQDLRFTPYQTRAKLAKLAPQNVVAVQPTGPILPDLEDIYEHEMEDIDGILLMQLAVGAPKLGDYDYFTRVCTYRDLAEKYLEPDRFLLSLLPLFTRRAGLYEALWQALIQRNFGANHSYAGGNKLNHSKLRPNDWFDKSYEGHNLITEFIHELGMKILPSLVPANEPDQDRSNSKVLQDAMPDVLNTSPYLNIIKSSPWHHFEQEISKKLTEVQPAKHEKGVCVWFTGLSGSGKSTIAEMLSWSLLEHGRRVTVLDGDVVRTHLSKGLGFSKEDRDTNVRRIGFVASELVRLGGVVICAVISPYLAVRKDVRNMVGQDQFVEVFVDTPLDVCEARDVKSIYARARRGELTGLTGIDDPYEAPIRPEITMDAVNHTPEENAHTIINYLISQGFIYVS